MTIGEEIRLRRTALGMAQYDLADALMVCPSAVYKWETGKSKPTFRKVRALAKIFGVSEQELLNPTPIKENEDSKNVL